MSAERVEMINWVNDAACRGKPQEWFFPVGKGSRPPKEALQLCAGCPVREPCAAEGVRYMGVWGGKLNSENRTMGTRHAEVRCRHCGGFFMRDVGTKDMVCDSCLPVSELQRRNAARRKRALRARGTL